MLCYNCDKLVNEMILHSNLIEREGSDLAFADARLAWDVAEENRGHIGLEYILAIHRALMHRLDPMIAGKLRDCSVRIGGRLKPFVSEALIKEDLKRWVELVNTSILDKNYNPSELEDFTKKVHVQFEQIHPFTDGNGRVGRILYNIHRLNVGLPIHIIHVGKEQMAYYDWFRTTKRQVNKVRVKR